MKTRTWVSKVSKLVKTMNSAYCSLDQTLDVHKSRILTLSISEIKFENMHLTDKAGLKFISDDLVRDVYKSPEILKVCYKTKHDIKRKNKTPVCFPKISFTDFRIFISKNFRSNVG